MSAAGNHTLVAPAGLSTSARVVTSNLRQTSADACCANESSPLDNARLATAKLVDRKKSRRFMNYPYEIPIKAGTSIQAATWEKALSCEPRIMGQQTRDAQEATPVATGMHGSCGGSNRRNHFLSLGCAALREGVRKIGNEALAWACNLPQDVVQVMPRIVGDRRQRGRSLADRAAGYIWIAKRRGG